MSEIRRVIVTGSRDWPDRDLIERAIRRIAEISTPDAILVHGDCRGVDQTAACIWKALGRPCEVHPADWEAHGRAAGPIRNQKMVNLGADICIAFVHQNSKGASNCADLAQRAGIKTHRIASSAHHIAWNRTT